MSDLHALIRACKDEPDDDAPRLILADWLDEHGDADRAAFIRKQIAEPGVLIDDCPFNPEWLGEWRRRQSPEWWFRAYRGFFWISDRGRELYDRLDEILRPPFDWTWIDGFMFGSWHDGDWTPLFRSPLLQELNWLEFIDDECGSNLIRPLVDCSFLTHLRHLKLLMVVDQNSRYQSISQSRHLSQLKSLEIAHCALGRRAARAFAASEVWDNLESCVMHWNRFGNSALAELANGRVRPNLKYLDISFGHYTDQGLVQFSRSTCFPALNEMRIGYVIWPEGHSPTFGPLGIESLLSASRECPFQLSVRIRSREPVPGDLEEFCRSRSDRVVLKYSQPGQRLD